MYGEYQEDEELQRRINDKNDYIIDNSLRVSLLYFMVKNGIIKVKKIMDINSEVYISRFNPDTYIGVCKDCPEMYGVNFKYKKNE